MDVHLHLPQVLMFQVPHLQVNEHETLQDKIIEHQVNPEITPLKGNPLLPGDEGEPTPQLQKKFLKVGD